MDKCNCGACCWLECTCGAWEGPEEIYEESLMMPYALVFSTTLLLLALLTNFIGAG